LICGILKILAFSGISVSQLVTRNSQLATCP